MEKLELIHSDICGPMQIATHIGYLYLITFINDLTRFIYVCLMKTNSKVVT